MITKEQQELIEKANKARAENPNSRPSKEELQAIDAFLIEQAKERIEKNRAAE